MKLKVKTATTFWDKVLGLIDPRNKPPLHLITRFGIHTFFLKKPIDILVLNDNYQITKIKESLKPNQFYFYSPFWKHVIEMSEGEVRKRQFKLNDKITLEK